MDRSTGALSDAGVRLPHSQPFLQCVRDRGGLAVGQGMCGTLVRRAGARFLLPVPSAYDLPHLQAVQLEKLCPRIDYVLY